MYPTAGKGSASHFTASYKNCYNSYFLLQIKLVCDQFIRYPYCTSSPSMYCSWILSLINVITFTSGASLILPAGYITCAFQNHFSNLSSIFSAERAFVFSKAFEAHFPPLNARKTQVQAIRFLYELFMRRCTCHLFRIQSMLREASCISTSLPTVTSTLHMMECIFMNWLDRIMLSTR